VTRVARARVDSVILVLTRATQTRRDRRGARVRTLVFNRSQHYFYQHDG